MSAPAVQAESVDRSSQARSDVEQLEHALEHARHLLPAQAPLADFVHHNTLHAFEHLPFHDAVAAAADVHDAEPFLSEERYRALWREGRISHGDVAATLDARAAIREDARIGPLTVRAIEEIVLQHGIEAEAPAGLRWRIAEQGVIETFREDVSPASRIRIVERTEDWLDALDEAGVARLEAMLQPWGSVGDLRRLAPTARAVCALWAVCRALAPVRPDPVRARLLPRVGKDRTHRDLLVALGAPDPARRVGERLVLFLPAFLDLGMARWSMPARERGLLHAYRAHLGVLPATLPGWLRRARRRLERDASAHEIGIAVLRELGVATEHWDAFLARVLLEQPGFSGMVACLERQPVSGAPAVALADLAAIRLALWIEAVAESAAAIGHRGSLEAERLVATAERIWARDERRRAHDRPFRLFQLCQLAGLAAPDLLALGASGASRLLEALDAFDALARRRTLHEAYERSHARLVLGALADTATRPADPAAARARFQAVFCIDDREESIRRAFEELGADHVTFSAAGFFGVAMQYVGLDDPTPSALCPVVVRPSHQVHEVPHPEHAELAVRRIRVRARLARARFAIEDASRSLLRGAVLTPVLGLLSAAPMLARVLVPRAAARAVRALLQRIVPEVRTRLAVARELAPEEPTSGAALPRGFTLEERVERVASLLENIGLVSGFARLVVFLGHGAATVNNPHHAAYECGACGGRSGGPNARALAAMANEPAVRAALRARGIDIPDTTYFLGGMHDTTADAIALFDVDAVPPSFAADLEALRRSLDHARSMSAHERCRRFEHAPPSCSPEQALEHVEERAVDLAEARPELGHATNAICVVGRRALTRGLFLDRRAFLVSYDAEVDDGQARILERILGAVLPVCAGINLEYFFSTIDPLRYGCGTKLPHNVGALVGVMEGASGDLRTGLPLQMTEIHEPVRLLCVVEAAPTTVLDVVGRRPDVARLVRNGWVRVAAIHPRTREVSVYEGGRFVAYAGRSELPVVRAAADWYAGRTDFLAPARIEPLRGGWAA